MFRAKEIQLIRSNIEDYLKVHERKDLLRFITCGSVDDGKSTLIGRMLYESNMIFEDQLAALEEDSRRVGTCGNNIDFALLMDGLAAEREQGITIDVSYRYFSTDKRKFIVADTPGHEQYTRNMITGASTADLAILLVDARTGLLTQTRRHAHLMALLGIKHVVLAVTKMDLVSFSEEVFLKIKQDFEVFGSSIGLDPGVAIPISGTKGTNVVVLSRDTPWYEGPTLIRHLETVDVRDTRGTAPFRFPVQWVNRPHLNFRGYAGTIASGRLRPGDPVTVSSSGRTTTVKEIVTYDGTQSEAVEGQAVTLTLSDEIDVSRGDVLSHVEDPIRVSDQFEVTLFWMSDQDMVSGRSFLMKTGPSTVPARVLPLKYKIDVDTQEHLAGNKLQMNELGVVNISTARRIAYDPYSDNKETGSFIFIDRLTNETVGAGKINFGLHRADNIHWQSLLVNKKARAELNGHRGVAVWFTGLSGSGKSTLANLLEKRLFAEGKRTYLLDGDNLRHGLNRDLGFSEVDRIENIRRVAEVARLMVDAGMIVLCAFISPFRADRDSARKLFDPAEFVEIFVDAPLSVVEQRDPKGLYKKARSGLLPNFTGIDSAYEEPSSPELVVKTAEGTPEQSVDEIYRFLNARL